MTALRVQPDTRDSVSCSYSGDVPGKSYFFPAQFDLSERRFCCTSYTQKRMQIIQHPFFLP